MRIDLNCDLGESFGAYSIGDDERVMAHVTSANLACGAHAGDPGIMRATVKLALAAGVSIGAHPGFADIAGFGRREMTVAPQEVEDLVLFQIGALAGIARAQGARLRHVKPHGALYNMAARDRTLADAVARAVASFDDTLVLFGLSGSSLLDAGRNAGLTVAAEVFADRAYEPDGALVAREQPGAVVHDPEAVVRHAIQMVRDGTVTAVDGAAIPLAVDTICVHGDTPGAADLAMKLRAGLQAAGVDVKPVTAP